MDDVQNDASKSACIGGTGTKMCQVPWQLKFDMMSRGAFFAPSMKLGLFILPSRKLTYPPKMDFFEDDFPFPQVGYVNSLEGNSSWIKHHRTFFNFWKGVALKEDHYQGNKSFHFAPKVRWNHMESQPGQGMDGVAVMGQRHVLRFFGEVEPIFSSFFKSQAMDLGQLVQSIVSSPRYPKD